MASSPRVKAWQTDALWQLKKYKGTIRDYPVHLTLVFSFADNRRHDLDNAASTVLDILREAGIIADDDYRHICPLTLDCDGVDRQNPRVEIFIKETKSGKIDTGGHNKQSIPISDDCEF